MSENEQDINETEDLNTTDEPVTEPKMTDGIDEQEDKAGTSGIPEGLDADIYDTETGTLKENAVIERLKDLNNQIASAKKQANDMRRKLSKGVSAPDKIEDYSANYQPMEKFEFINTDESEGAKHAKEMLGVLDDFAFNHGLSVETAKDLKNLYLQYAEDVQIIDGRSDEYKAVAKAAFITEQKKLLGDDADKIIRDNVKFFKEYGIFNNEERKALLSAMDTNATWNSIGLKLRKLFGQNTSADIPVRDVAINGLADDMTLAREYFDDKTTDGRREEILRQRAANGRKGGLPIPH